LCIYCMAKCSTQGCCACDCFFLHCSTVLESASRRGWLLELVPLTRRHCSS
jgi:hypothetical protein